MKRNSLNQAYRLVWNHARGCWMAVAETCRSRGKSGRSGGVVAAAVVAALGALGGQSAMAAPGDSCDDPSGATSIVAGSSNMCSLGGNESVNIISSGSIVTSASPAITATGTLNNVTNAGSVSSTTMSAIQNVGTVGSIVNTGNVSAGAGSAINNATISGRIASISNSGTLGGSVGVQNIGTVTGIVNTSTGNILGNTAGVSSSGQVGTLSNMGLITGGSGAGVLGTGGSFASIVNSGTVQGLGGDASGVALSSTSITGSISNSGVIAGNSDGVVIGSGASVNGLTNTQLISGTSYAGVFVDGGYVNTINNGSRSVTSTVSGTIYTTQTAATVSGAESGIEIDNGGVDTIVNTGVIQGGGWTAGIVNEGGSVSQLINNAQTYTNTTVVGSVSTTSTGTLVGNITGGDYGIKNTLSGYFDTISNTGLIQGSVSGILNTDASIGTITNGIQTFAGTSVVGSITGEDYGIETSGTESSIGLISNAGLIQGTTGIYTDRGTLGTVINTGTILGSGIGDADSIGIDLNNTHIDAVTNAGLISGDYAGIQFDGAQHTATSTITNTTTSYVTLTPPPMWTTGTFGVFSTQSECESVSGTTCSSISSPPVSTPVTSVSTSTVTTLTPSALTSLVNQEGGTITAGTYGIHIASGTVAGLSNEGLIARLPDSGDLETLEKRSYSVGILNEDTIGVLSNSGVIGVAGTEAPVEEEPSEPVALVAAVTPLASAEQRFDVGIGNEGTINSLTNTNQVLALDEGISNSGTINNFYNGEDGTVSGLEVGVYNSELIGSLTNDARIEGVTYTGINNYGTINTLTNENNGVISGGEDGIYTNDLIGNLYNSGVIEGVTATGIVNYGTINILSNNNGAAVSGGEDGVFNGDYVGNLSNSGLIQGTTSTGVKNYSTIASLSNGEDGVITGGQHGVANIGTITGLSNAGQINGTTLYGVSNSSIGNIGTLSNLSGGSISGGSAGVLNQGTIGQLSNAGLIDGRGTVTGVYNAGTINNLINSGTVDGGTATGIYNSNTISSLYNTVGGTITAGTYGIFNSAGTIGQLVNDGLIDSTGEDNVAISNSGTIANGLSNSGTIAGIVRNNGRIESDSNDALLNNGSITAIVNTTDGIIIGHDDNGIENNGTVGSIDNSGLIEGDYSALYNDGTIDTLTNAASGTISSFDTGVYNDGDIGQLDNSGLIEGVFEDGIYNDGTISSLTNEAGGTITGIYGISNDSVITTLNNSGLIVGSSFDFDESAGIYNDGTIGSLVNAAGGTITGEDGIVNRFSSINTLSNSGLIEGTDLSGIYSNGTIGSLVNASSGTISGFGDGIWNDKGGIGSLDNSGHIDGDEGAGVLNAGSISSLTNHAGGTIHGANMGINTSGGISTLSNSGVVSGSIAGVFNSGSMGNLTNAAGGTISGEGAGVYNGFSSGANIGTLNNAGVIRATDGDGNAVYNTRTIGSLINSGLIVGVDHAIYNDGTITNGITNTGTLQGKVNVGGATLNLLGTTARVTGSVSGSGRVLVGNGEDTAYFTSEGNFAVDGGVSVATSATLALHNGAQVGYSLDNAGTVFLDAGTGEDAVGNRATVTGAYNQTGVLSIGAASASNYGQLTVTGAATLSSAASFDVDVKETNTLAFGETLHNVLSAGTLTGTSADELSVTDNSFLLEFDAVHDGNTVDLNVTYSGIGAAMQTLGFTPGTGAGNALDSILNECLDSESAVCGTLSGFLNTMLQQGSGAGVANLVGQALPLMQSNMQLSLLGAQQQITNLIEQRQVGGQASGDGWLTQRQMWFKPLASRLEQDNVNGVAGYKANTGGFVLGAEGSIDAANRLGLALAYTNTRVKGQTSTMTHDAKFDGYQLIAYGTSAMPSIAQGVDLNWQADVGFGTTKGRRSAFNGVANSDYKTHSIHVGAGLSREMPLGDGLSITPLVRADYTTLRDKAYTETGSGLLTLVVNKRTTDQFIVSAGAKLNKKLDSQWLLSGSANLGVDLINEASVLAARFTAGGPLFSTTGIKPKAWIGGLGLNLQYKPSETVSWEFGYDMSTRSNYTDQTLSVKIKWAF